MGAFLRIATPSLPCDAPAGALSPLSSWRVPFSAPRTCTATSRCRYPRYIQKMPLSLFEKAFRRCFRGHCHLASRLEGFGPHSDLAAALRPPTPVSLIPEE